MRVNRVPNGLRESHGVLGFGLLTFLPAYNRRRIGYIGSMQRGILIAFDGIDGVGKTTQANLLAQSLRDAGIEVVQSKEPTQGKWGQMLRDSALKGRLPLDQELEYFVRDREEHLDTLIRPALSEGRAVILDRYYYSTVAYQGSRGANAKSILARMKEFVLIPDITFLIDLDVKDALHRIHRLRGEEPNYFEQAEQLESARSQFLDLSRTEREIVRVDSQFPIDQIHSVILQRFVDGPLKDRLCAKPYESDCGACGLRMVNSCEWWSSAPTIKPSAKATPILAAS